MSKTQKEISKRYEGKRNYHVLIHYLRSQRLWFGLGALAVGALLALFFLSFLREHPLSANLYNVGKISRAHSWIAQTPENCQACHVPKTGPVSFIPLAGSQAALETGCNNCHKGFNFHVAAVVQTDSCISCHHEHLGSGPMQAVTSSSCLSCHNNTAVMEAAQAMVLKIPSNFLELPRPKNVVFYPEPRLPDGFTKVFSSFDGAHPDFRYEADKIDDDKSASIENIKFSHKLHMDPAHIGEKLSCAGCHQLDATKSYMQKVSYETSCERCHSLQFDVDIPKLYIPHPTNHGDSSSVYNFLLTLPAQIEKFARNDAEANRTPKQVAEFVAEKVTALRERTRQGDDLLHDVFYANNYRDIVGSYRKSVGTITDRQREQATYPGCAYCHTIADAGTSTPSLPVGMNASSGPMALPNPILSPARIPPAVLKPTAPDRWMAHGNFDHSRHTMLACEECHQGVTPTGTPILATDHRPTQLPEMKELVLPTKASCVTCHSAKGGATSTCVTCHQYHHEAPEGLKTAAMGPVKGMFLGKD